MEWGAELYPSLVPPKSAMEKIDCWSAAVYFHGVVLRERRGTAAAKMIADNRSGNEPQKFFDQGV